MIISDLERMVIGDITFHNVEVLVFEFSKFARRRVTGESNDKVAFGKQLNYKLVLEEQLGQEQEHLACSSMNTYADSTGSSSNDVGDHDDYKTSCLFGCG